MSTVKTSKRGPKPVLRDKVILDLKESKKATSADLAVSTAYLIQLEQKGFVRRVGKQSKPGKGRSKVVFGLTNKGRGRVRTLSRKMESVAA